MTLTCDGVTDSEPDKYVTNSLSSNSLEGVSSSDSVTPSALTHWQYAT